MLDLFFSLKYFRGYDSYLIFHYINYKAISITEVIEFVLKEYYRMWIEEYNDAVVELHHRSYAYNTDIKTLCRK